MAARSADTDRPGNRTRPGPPKRFSACVASVGRFARLFRRIHIRGDEGNGKTSQGGAPRELIIFNDLRNAQNDVSSSSDSILAETINSDFVSDAGNSVEDGHASAAAIVVVI